MNGLRSDSIYPPEGCTGPPGSLGLPGSPGPEEYGYDWRALHRGYVIEFEGSPGKEHLVVDVHFQAGRNGLGGMSMGRPDEWTVVFHDGSYIYYDDWMDLKRYRVPFKIIGRTNKAPRRLRANVNQAGVRNG